MVCAERPYSSWQPRFEPARFFFQSLLKEHLNKHGHISRLDRLAVILKMEWEAIPQQVIQDSIDSWIPRLRRVGRAAGAYVEKIIIYFW